MQIQVSTRHGQLDETARKLIEEKAAKLLHFFDRITMIEVTVEMRKPDLFEVELRVDAEHKHDFVAQDEDAQLTVAMDKALTRMQHQIQRYKQKIQDHRRDVPTGEGPNHE